MFRILLLADLHGVVPKLPLFDRSHYDVVIIAGDVTIGTKVPSRVDAFFKKLDFLGEFYFLPGNSDYPFVLEMPLSNQNAKVLHKKVVHIGEYEIFGTGGATTGLINYFAFNDSEFRKNLDEVYASTRASPNKQILVIHDPPFNTGLDFTLRKEHVGAPSVRKIIEEKHPLLALCGHIHEARGMEKIGNTTCINAGAVKLGSGAEIFIKNEAIQVKWLDLE